MKILTYTICGLLAATTLGFAQAVVETISAPVQLRGTVTTFDPAANALVVSGANAAPVTYQYTKTTTMVDEAGNPVTVEIVKSGIPVTVYYTNANGQLVASKVVVHKVAAPVMEETTTTTTTTTKDD